MQAKQNREARGTGKALALLCSNWNSPVLSTLFSSQIQNISLYELLSKQNKINSAQPNTVCLLILIFVLLVFRSFCLFHGGTNLWNLLSTPWKRIGLLCCCLVWRWLFNYLFTVVYLFVFLFLTIFHRENEVYNENKKINVFLAVLLSTKQKWLISLFLIY